MPQMLTIWPHQTDVPSFDLHQLWTKLWKISIPMQERLATPRWRSCWLILKERGTPCLWRDTNDDTTVNRLSNYGNPSTQTKQSPTAWHASWKNFALPTHDDSAPSRTTLTEMTPSLPTTTTIIPTIWRLFRWPRWPIRKRQTMKKFVDTMTNISPRREIMLWSNYASNPMPYAQDSDTVKPCLISQLLIFIYPYMEGP